MKFKSARQRRAVMARMRRQDDFFGGGINSTKKKDAPMYSYIPDPDSKAKNPQKKWVLNSAPGVGYGNDTPKKDSMWSNTVLPKDWEYNIDKAEADRKANHWGRQVLKGMTPTEINKVIEVPDLDDKNYVDKFKRSLKASESEEIKARLDNVPKDNRRAALEAAADQYKGMMIGMKARRREKKREEKEAKNSRYSQMSGDERRKRQLEIINNFIEG